MEKLILNFPNNLNEALEIASTFNPVLNNEVIQQVVVCGMGGSGIGGKIVGQWVESSSRVPVISVQDYTLPAFVGPNTLVVGSSYSGNTEETLFALREAQERNAQIVGICSGGQVQEFCKKHNYPYVIVPGGNPPRTALAYSLVQLSKLFLTVGLASKTILKEIGQGELLIRAQLDSIQEKAMEVANELQGRVVAVYASANYEAITIRTKQQLNENSKELAWQNVIPEMNHNELVGWGGGDNRFAALFLQTNDLSLRNQKRFDISVERTKSKTDKVVVLEALGDTMVEKSIYLIHLLDWVSLYLSNLKNGDPIEIEIIDYLKEELGKIKE
jgi:glucose/mannose-6-phosphate isomerase